MKGVQVLMHGLDASGLGWVLGAVTSYLSESESPGDLPEVVFTTRSVFARDADALACPTLWIKSFTGRLTPASSASVRLLLEAVDCAMDVGTFAYMIDNRVRTYEDALAHFPDFAMG